MNVVNVSLNVVLYRPIVNCSGLASFIIILLESNCASSFENDCSKFNFNMQFNFFHQLSLLLFFCFGHKIRFYSVVPHKP